MRAIGEVTGNREGNSDKGQRRRFKGRKEMRDRQRHRKEGREFGQTGREEGLE